MPLLSEGDYGAGHHPYANRPHPYSGAMLPKSGEPYRSHNVGMLGRISKSKTPMRMLVGSDGKVYLTATHYASYSVMLPLE